jgi:hypothetical protein
VAIATAMITGTQTITLSRSGDEKMLAPGTAPGVGDGKASPAIPSQIT